MSEITWPAICATCSVELTSTEEWLEHMRTEHNDKKLTHPENVK